MKHPNQATLALHAGGDLGRFGRWATARHVANCDRCRHEVAAFEEMREILPELREIPEISWDRLAAEMKANIRLGLEAGECVREVERPLSDRSLFTGGRMVLTFATIVVLALSTLVLERPWQTAEPNEDIVAQATADGIQVDQRGQGISLMNRNRSNETVMHSVSWQGSASAQYIDRDTGIITVNSVDGQ
jgi:hypothetical protein